MTKRILYCPICERDLGRFHHNQSTRPLRDHIYFRHPSEYQEIVSIVQEIDERYERLKAFEIGHFDMHYFHDNVEFEISLENHPPMSEDKRKELLSKIMKDD